MDKTQQEAKPPGQKIYPAASEDSPTEYRGSRSPVSHTTPVSHSTIEEYQKAQPARGPQDIPGSGGPSGPGDLAPDTESHTPQANSVELESPEHSSLPTGTSLHGGAYILEERLGTGGFGITYRARHIPSGEDVAIKEYFPQGSTREETTVTGGALTRVGYKDGKGRFLQEAETLAQFNHPNIVRVITAFEENNTAYMVMEFIQGKTLLQKVEVQGPLEESEALDIIRAAGEALEAVHRAGLLHRDIKPSNIMQTRSGRVVLIDFGAAKEYISGQNQTHTVMVTRGYAPIEQYEEHAPRGPFTDVYALAATLYHLLTGTAPVTPMGRLAGVRLQSLKQLNPGASDVVDRAVSRGLEVEPHRRPQSVGDFLALLRGELGSFLPNDPTPTSSHPYRLNEHSATDLPGLAEVMFLEQETAVEDLVSGDSLVNWISSLDSNIARGIRRDRDRYRQWPQAALLGAITRCDPGRPFLFRKGFQASTVAEWMEQAECLLDLGLVTPEEFDSGLLLQLLEVWLERKSDPQPELAAQVAQIRESAKNPLAELSYLLFPQRPYRLLENLEAVTPAEMVRQTYAEPGDWLHGIPPSYQASFRRWQQGFLTAWLRQREMAPLAEQCDRAAQELSGEPYTAFETILRLLDPALSPVQLEIAAPAIAREYIIPHGSESPFDVPYAAIGCGMPSGRMKITCASPGARLDSETIRQREGALRIIIRAEKEVPVSQTLGMTLELESTTTELSESPVPIHYRVSFPVAVTLQRIAAGAAIGAALLGIPRWLLAHLGETRPIALDRLNLNSLWQATSQLEFPYWNDILGFLLVGICFYIGWRIWTTVLQRTQT